jgi:hypothetical protein
VLTWDGLLLGDLVGVVSWFEEIVCDPGLKSG